MPKIDIRYTIRYSYAGVSQYEVFYELEGRLHRPRFSPSWAKKVDVPSVEGVETIYEVLEIIKNFAYNNRAEIYLINGLPVDVYKNKKALTFLKNFSIDLDSFIEAKALEYWEKYLMPIMSRNKWFIGPSAYGAPVLIYKNDVDAWDNIRNTKEIEAFETLCFKFVNRFGKGKSNLDRESGNYVEGFQHFINYIPNEYLLEKETYIELN